MSETGAPTANCPMLISKQAGSLSMQIVLWYKHMNRKEAVAVTIHIGFHL